MDYAPYVDIASVRATNNVVANQDGMEFDVYVDGEVPAPRAGMEVIWQRWNASTQTETVREFGGVITTVTETTDGPTLIYKCRAQSYLRWFDRRLVTGYFQQQHAETTMRQIIQRHCPGFSVTNVNAPITIAAQYANYRKPSSLMEQICGQIGYGWYISYYRDVHVFALENFVSPLPNNILDVDNDYVNYGDLEVTEDAENVYNRFTIRGFKVRSNSTYTLYFTGDGQTTQWSLGYRVSSAKGDVVVTVNGQPYVVKRDVLEGIPGAGGDAGVAYIHFTQHLVRFATPPAPGAQIVVTFYYLVDRTRIDQDDASVNYMRVLENTPASDGIYEYAQLNKSLTQSTQAAVTSQLQLLALKHGFPTLAGTFSSFTTGWRAGQNFRMTSARRMGGLSLDSRYYVYRVTKEWISPKASDPSPIQYTIEFADKPYLV